MSSRADCGADFPRPAPVSMCMDCMRKCAVFCAGTVTAIMSRSVRPRDDRALASCSAWKRSASPTPCCGDQSGATEAPPPSIRRIENEGEEDDDTDGEEEEEEEEEEDVRVLVDWRDAASGEARPRCWASCSFFFLCIVSIDSMMIAWRNDAML